MRGSRGEAPVRLTHADGRAWAVLGQPEVPRPQSGLSAVAHAQLLQDGGYIVLDRALGQLLLAEPISLT